MTHTRRQWLLTTASAVAARRSLLSAAPWIRLWNGHDFTGWRRAAPSIWTVEDGAIVGRSDHAHPGPGYLMTETEYQDFRLRLEFWVSSNGNSGIYIREPLQRWGPNGDDRPGHGTPRGYEVQIDFHDEKNLTGSIYNIHPVSMLAGGDERWNRMEIECRGPRVRVWTNGELVNDYSGLEVQAGVVGFQIHGQRPHDHVVKFRNIELRNLPPE